MTPEGGWPIAALRALADASLLSMLGALVFRACVGAAGLVVARWSAAVAFVALPAWVAAQAVNLGGSLGAVPDVVAITSFGHLAAGSWLCAAAVVVLAGPGWRGVAALAAALLAVVLHAGHSHAAAMEPGWSVLRVSVTLHLLAAGAWLGGLIPLGRMVARAPLPELVVAIPRYSVLGLGCVILLAGTAGWQASVLVGGLAGWVGTEYGVIALTKVALFGVLVGFAILNRQWLSPRLSGPGSAVVRRRLAASIAAETAAGLAIVTAAALLSSIEPAMHQQPTWPFSLQPSLVSVNEDPDIRREVLLAALGTGAALMVAVVSLVVRRFRIAAFGVVVVAVVLSRPHLALLFVPAYSTSYFRSPTGFAAASIMRGAALFPGHCAGCHGAAGQGDGPLARQLPAPPADLTAAHLWMHGDGELFWWLSRGIEGPAGGLVMPGLSPALGDDDLWALIDYVRANNAGLVHRAEGDWFPPLRAPDFTAACPDGSQLTLPDLRGRVVRLLFPGAEPPLPAPDPGVVTIVDGQSATGCAVADPAVRFAYALLLGVPPAALPGMFVLIDANGWLRADDGGRADPSRLAALVRQIRATPLAPLTGGHVHAQ